LKLQPTKRIDKTFLYVQWTEKKFLDANEQQCRKFLRTQRLSLWKKRCISWKKRCISSPVFLKSNQFWHFEV